VTDELLTPAEHALVEKLAEVWNDFNAICGNGPARHGDLTEACAHVHALQQAVLKQAAARAYPDRYRLLGGFPAGTPDSIEQITGGTPR